MSLIHWWPLNKSEEFYDKTSNTLLTNNSGTFTTSGKIGGAYHFSGANNCKLYCNWPAYMTSNVISVAFWIKLDSNWSGWGQVFTIGLEGADWKDIRFGVDIESSRIVRFSVSNGTNATSYSGPYNSVISTDTWYHIAATYNNGEMKLYINGSPATLPSYTTNIIPNFSGTKINVGGNASEVGECTMSDVRIYDHALSELEIKELSKALVIHYTFDDTLAESISASLLHNETGLSQPIETKNLQFITDAAVGSHAFQSNSSYIVHNSIGDGKHGALASMWIKMPLTSNWIAFVDYQSELGFGCYGGYGVLASVNNTNKRRTTSLSNWWKTDEWNHVVVTMNSTHTINRCWINGVEVSYGAPDHWTHNNASFVIGSRYSGAYGDYPSTVKIDDFRLYYTYPGDDKIEQVVQDLYKTKAYITDKSDIVCSEFIEDKADTVVTEKSTFECKEVYEQLDIGSGYERAEYIEFSEAQYIDTGLAFTDANIPIIIEADIVKTTISGNDCLAGCGNGNSWHGPVMLNCHSYTLEFGVNGYATASDGSGSIAANERMSIRAEIYTNGNDHKWYKNGNIINLGTRAYNNRTSSNSTLYIGAFHHETGNSIASGSCWIGRLYSFKVWYGNSCRILVPAKRKSDNAFGLYDMAEHNFYPNIGGGSLSGISALTNAAIYQDGHIGGREIIEI